MKKSYFLKLSLVLFCQLLGFSVVNAAQYDFEVDGIFYSINEDGSTVTVTTETEPNWSYDPSYSGDVVIPAFVDYDGHSYVVTTIDRYGFFQCSGLTSIVLPETLTTIGDGAFYGCTQMEDFDIPNSVSFIGYDVFRDTPWLANQPDGIVYAGKVLYTYKGTMPAGTSIEIREGTKCVAGQAFYNCKYLTSVTIPNSVTSFGERAFASCTGLTSIDLPDNITSVGWSGFENCSGLTSVVIPASLTTLNPRAFYGCSGLTSLIISEGVKKLDYESFQNCSGLTSLYLPKSVESISYEVFAGCTGLTEINVASDNPVYDSRENCNAIIISETNRLIVGCMNSFIPNTVNTIWSYAFQDCANLTSIFIPSSVTNIHSGSFSGCTSLTSIQVDNANPVFDSRGNCNAVIETATGTLVVGCQATVIPNSVTTIGARSFQNCKPLVHIDIPSSVTAIGDQAFYGCSALESLDLPNSITSIGRYAFRGCSSITTLVLPTSLTETDYCSFYECTGLTSLTIPNTITKIGYMSFYGCRKLTSVTLPSSITYIGQHAFSSCYGLRTVISLASTPPDLRDYGIESSCMSYGKLQVPITAVDDYRAATNWSKFKVIEGIFVPGMAFEVDGIRYKVTGDSTVCVTSKEVGADNYSGNVMIPDTVSYENFTFTVTSIDDNAFDGAEELTSVTIPASVTSIGTMAFQGCTALTSVTMGSGVTTIGEKAFNYCTDLQSVTCWSLVPPVMENVNVFSNRTYSQATLFVPNSVIDAYSAADFWFKFAHIQGLAAAGDVDGDGEIGIKDVSNLIDLLLDGSTPAPGNADVNGDGVVDIKDVSALIDALLNGN